MKGSVKKRLVFQFVILFYKTEQGILIAQLKSTANMSDKGSDSVCCSSSYPMDNEDDVDSSTGEFQIDNWNVDPDGSDEESIDLDVGVFTSDRDTVSYIDNTICLEFPKFSKGFQVSDFSEFVQKYVGEENLERLENWKYPNLWIMRVKTKEICENLLRMWKTKIKNKTCWINPYYSYELRGFLHWLPHFISDDDVKTQLSQFGDVVILENVVHDHWNGKIPSEVKYFGLRLKDGMIKNDMPHFLKFDGYRALVIVRGRQPACFHCREFGHSKKDCKMYKEKLDEYCKNTEARKPRIKPRGRRHRPELDVKSDSQDNKHQDETKSTSTSIIPAQKSPENIKSGLKQISSGWELAVDNLNGEILAILESLKEWKEKTIEMVEQTLANMEKNLRMNSALTEAEVKSIEFSIETRVKQSLDEIKRSTIEVIEETWNNLENVVTEHFGLDSNEALEKLIHDFETSTNQC